MRVDLSGVALAARWYDALTGRWLSADTIVPGAGNPQSLNRYTYVNNNPLAYIDPSGHVAWVPLGAAVGALIGAGVVYGTQVAANLNRGMDLGQALTTDLDAAKIVRGAVTGAVIGTGVGAVASLVAAGAATASVATAGTAATTAVTAAVSDDGGAGEAQALATVGQGIGRWVPEVAHMSRDAADYQHFVTGAQRKVFELGGVRFDGFVNGVLIEAKGHLGQFVDPATGSFRSWFTGKADLVNQALRQLDAAQGVPIRWYFHEASVLEAARRLFADAGITGIELIHWPLP